MDRATVYAGQVPLETDVLKAGQFSMVGIAKLSESVLGTGTYVSGFTLSQTGLSNLVAILGPGIIYQQANLEASAWSSMPAVTNSIEKQGILLNAVNLTFTPPGTSGQSQCFLVEVQYSDVDTGSLVLPYYNAAAPSVPFSGPGGAGTAQNTIRQGAVAYQVKAGTAATSGTQTVPTPDAGWTGIYVVTLAAGATSVNTANIAQYSAAPFIPVTLPNVPAGVQSGQWLFGVAGGTNNYTLSLVPTLLVLTTGSELLINFTNANTTTSPTLNVNGLGAKAIVKQGGGSPQIASTGINADISGWLSLIYDGANWRINGPVPSDAATRTSYANSSFRQTVAGTYSFTAPITGRYKMTAWGGGGGSGYCASTTSASGGGGGAGGVYTYFDLVAGTAYGYTVGAAGAGGLVSGPVNATAGGSTIFNGVTLATGGSPGVSVGSAGGQSGLGGGGGSGAINTLGRGVNGATGNTGQNVGTVQGGFGGNAGNGGGAGGVASNGNANPGNAPGGGAGGAAGGTYAGGAGAAGELFIEW